MRHESFEDFPFFDNFRVPDCHPVQANPDGTVRVLKLRSSPASGNGYGIRIADKSMEPRIGAGYILLVDYARKPRSGNVILGTINGQPFVKKFLRRKGRVILQSTNPQYADIEIKDSDRFVIAGVALRIVDGSL